MRSRAHRPGHRSPLLLFYSGFSLRLLMLTLGPRLASLLGAVLGSEVEKQDVASRSPDR